MDTSYDTTQLDTTQIDPTTLQSLLGDSQTSLIPESLVTTLIVSFVLLNVLGLLFFIFYVVGLIRKWKVESAVFRMQKDLAEIKVSLAKPAPQPQSSAQPATSNQLIAKDDSADATA